MKVLNTYPQNSFEDEINSHKRQIIAETLEVDESRIKRFIRIFLSKFQIFHSIEELEERTAEIFQQTAMQSLEKSIEFDRERSAFSWINGFALNVMKQTRSRVLNHRKIFEDGFEDFERIEKLRRKIETTALPEERFWQKSERNEDEKFKFEQVITGLKIDYQKILRLHYFEELNIVEISAHLGKSEGAAQRQLNRAEIKLREILRKKEKRNEEVLSN